MTRLLPATVFIGIDHGSSLWLEGVDGGGKCGCVGGGVVPGDGRWVVRVMGEPLSLPESQSGVNVLSD